MTSKAPIQIQFANIEDGLFKILMNRPGLALLVAILHDEPGTFEHRRAIVAKLDQYAKDAKINDSTWKECMR